MNFEHYSIHNEKGMNEKIVLMVQNHKRIGGLVCSKDFTLSVLNQLFKTGFILTFSKIVHSFNGRQEKGMSPVVTKSLLNYSQVFITVHGHNKVAVMVHCKNF